MKVLFYCLTFYPENSGYSNAFQNLVRAISANLSDVQIDLVTPNNLGDKPEIELRNLNVIRLDYKLSKNKLGFFINSYLFAKEFNRIFQQDQYDMVFVETFEDYVFLASLNSEVYKKLVVRIHSTFETEYMVYFPNAKYKAGRYILKNYVFNKVRYIASTNNFHLEFVKQHYLDNNLYKIASKNFFVLPNTMPSPTASLEKHTINSGKLQFFTLGRMDEGGYLQKGFEDLLNALVLIKDKAMSQMEITIVGRGEYQTKLKKKAQKNGLSFVKFLESLSHSETLEQLSMADVVVLPSRYEGLSMFALEAIANNNVVLFSRTGGLIDLVKDNGYLFTPQNIDDLAQKIERILACSSEEINQMKLASRRLFNEKFSEQRTAEKFYQILDIVKADN